MGDFILIFSMVEIKFVCLSLVVMEITLQNRIKASAHNKKD